MEQDVILFVVNFIRQTHPLDPGDNIEELRYIEQGLVSSMEIMRLVFDLEERFSIRFDDDELVDSRFQTIGGLAKMVSDKASGRQ